MGKTVYQYLIDKNIKTFAAAKAVMIGKKVRILANSNGHSYGPVGTVFVVDCWTNFSTTNIISTNSCTMKLGTSGYISFSNVEIYEPVTIEDIVNESKELQNQITELQKKIEENNKKIELMDELGLKEYDEEIFKIMRTLAIVENKKMTKLKKAQVIKELLNS